MAPWHVYRPSDLAVSRTALAAEIGAGHLTVVARGWYAAPQADRDIVRSLRLGGRLTCLSAARLHGLWTPSDRQLHIAVRSGDLAPTVAGVTTHRLSTAGWPTPEPVLPLPLVLGHALRDHSTEVGLTLLESAVEKRLISVSDAHDLIRAQSRRKRSRGLQHFDPRAGSGSETRVRLFFQRLNIPVVAQAQIAGVGRVDLLVGESLVIEVDSSAYHRALAQYEEDCRRSLELTALGFYVVRLSYTQVFDTWNTTVQALRNVLKTGRHRVPPSPAAVVWLPELPRLVA